MKRTKSQDRKKSDDLDASASSQAAIAEIIKSIPRGDHLTAPEVFEMAKARGLSLSLSTVYRTLGKLKAEGDVITVSGDRGLRYEAAEEGPAHDHLICLGCGLTIEFYDDLIRGFGKNVAQRKGFEHTASRFDILGYCENCKASDEGRRLVSAEEEVNLALERVLEAAGELRVLQGELKSRRLNQSRQALKSARHSLEGAVIHMDSLDGLLID